MKRLYLDHSATSFPKPQPVLDEARRFLSDDSGNAGRGVHALATRAADALAGARRDLGELLGCPAPRIALLPGATYGLNAVVQGALQPGSRVILGPDAHTSVLRPLGMLGAEVVEVRTDDALRWDLGHLEALLTQPAAMVAVSHGSNVTGAVQDLRAISELAHATGALVLADGAQTAGAIPINLEAACVDAFAFSGHKGLLGPTGSGGLYLRKGLTLKPWISGGTGSKSHDETPPRDFPGGWEVGTPNAWAFATLRPALAWIAEQGVATIHERSSAVAARIRDGLREIPGVRVHGANRPGDLPVVSFTAEGWPPTELAVALDAHGVSVRPGLHCAPRAHTRLGTLPEGTLRASVGPFLAEEDAADFLERLNSLLG